MKFIYKEIARLSNDSIQQTVNLLQDYITILNDIAKANTYEDLECSMNLPFDTDLLKKVQDLATKKTTHKLKYIILIGIGGSNLGTKAIYDALYGFYDILQSARFPKIIFLDTQDEEVLAKTKMLIETLSSKEEVLVNTISKSGGTTETAANLEIIYEALTRKFGDVKDRIVFTTDEGSKMHQVAIEKNVDILNLPKLVGGRFSVFSAVGLFPLACIGFNLDNLLRGAQNMRNRCLKYGSEDNPGAISAAILYLHWKAGININDNFIFLPQLESLGKWYRQLMGESIGKDGKGITPTVSIGSTDLHSVGQLYLGGPKDKITTFIYGVSPKYEALVPQYTTFGLVDTIPQKHIHTIMSAIVEGTQAAYTKQELPYLTITLEQVAEEQLGEFMQFKMMEMMYLGHLMEVTTFDQPHVELYKVETKRILNTK